MTEIILGLFPSRYTTYIEGFGGGASVLLSKPIGTCEIYNDLYENVYSLMKVISSDEDFKKMKETLDKLYFSEQLHDEFKEDLLRNDLTLVERAVRFFYVARSSFNGIGGFSINLSTRRGMSKSTSDFLSAITDLTNVHERLSRVVITNRDVFDLLQKYNNKDTFFYLDPPYVQSTRRSSQKYAVDFTDEQHERLIDVALNSKAKILISGYDSPIYRRLETKFHKYTFKSPNAVSKAEEVLWYNYEHSSNVMNEFFEK